MFGFLNIYKPQGKTSHDVVAILRRVTKIKQIGHTGTLDPFAEGVLPVCIGKSTRLIEYLKDDKAYIGTVQLGKSTTTYDTEGEVVNTSTKTVTQDEIQTALKQFQGEIEQYPPIYSAIKVNGKKLYDYARAGKEVEIKPRKVCINEIKLLEFDPEHQTAKIYIDCSKGTYIRSIANDLGEVLGSYGYLIKLVRVKAGDFILENSIPLEGLETIEQVKSNLIYPLEYLNYPKYELNAQEKQDVSYGKPIKVNLANGICILTSENKLCAVSRITNNIAKIEKCFL